MRMISRVICVFEVAWISRVLDDSMRTRRLSAYTVAVLRNILLSVGVVCVGALLVFGLSRGGLLPRSPYPFESSKHYLLAGMASCSSALEVGWRAGCLQRLAAKIVGRYGVSATLVAVTDAQSDPVVALRCHAMMHYVGYDALNKATSIQEAYAQCAQQQACGRGCVHGVFEGYIVNHGNKMTAETIRSLCDNPSFDPYTRESCAHGVGHGLMLLEANEVIPAVALCDSFAEAPDRAACEDGVFMEQAFTNGRPKNKDGTVDTRTASTFCNRIPEGIRAICDGWTGVIISRGNAGYDGMARYCASVPAARQEMCYYMLGAKISWRRQQSVAADAPCRSVPAGAMMRSCVEGTIRSLIDGTLEGVKRAARLCESVEPSERSQCLAALTVTLDYYYPERDGAWCRSLGVSPTATEACTRGTRP